MPPIFLDIETTGLNPFTCGLVSLQLLAAGKALTVKDPKSLELLKPTLENNLAVGHNIKFDSKFLKHHYGITLSTVYDTCLAEIAISGGTLAERKGASLKDLVFKYCGVTLDKSEQCGFKTGEELTAEQLAYALNDVKYLPEIMRQQQVQIKLLGLEQTIELEMNAVPAVVWMELSGMKVDLDKLRAIAPDAIAAKKVSEEYILNELTPYYLLALEKEPVKAGKSRKPADFIFNPNSYTKLKMALLEKGYNKLKGTGRAELSKYSGDPLIAEILEYRSNSKLISSFIKPLLGSENKPGFVSPVSGRIHAEFKQYGTRSGRFSCKEPNLQQQPSRISLWRTIYVAETGNKLIVADYSQIEYRIVGELSGDQKFIEACNSGLDLHRSTASQMFNIPFDDVTKEEREKAKAIGFGLNYGLGAKGLKTNLKVTKNIDITEAEACNLKRNFQAVYPVITDYLDKAANKSFQDGSVRTLAGRLCKTRDSESKPYTIKNRGKNLPIQGLCADMLKTAMGNLFLILEPRGVKLVNCVHDELVLECRAEEAEVVASIVKAEMEKAGNLYLTDVPCVVEVTIGDHWKKG